jgi:hypothetical protein
MPIFLYISFFDVKASKTVIKSRRARTTALSAVSNSFMLCRRFLLTPPHFFACLIKAARFPLGAKRKEEKKRKEKKEYQEAHDSEFGVYIY